MMKQTIINSIISILNAENISAQLLQEIIEAIETCQISWQKKRDLMKDLASNCNLFKTEDITTLNEMREKMAAVLETFGLCSIPADHQKAAVELVYHREPTNILAVKVYSQYNIPTDKDAVLLSNNFHKEEGQDPVFMGGAILRIESMDEDLFKRRGYLAPAKATTFVSKPGGISVRDVDNFSDEILLLDFSRAGLPNNPKNIISNVLENNKIYMVKTGISCGFFYPIIFGNKTVGFSKIYSNKAVDMTVDVFNQYKEAGYVTTYYSYISSPSAQRQTNLYFIKAKEDDSSYAEDKITDIIDNVTEGASSVILSGDEINYTNAVKNASRLSLFMTGSTEFGYVNSLAIYVGEFNYEGVVYRDGCGTLNYNVVADAYQRRFGRRIPKRDILGNGIQGRFGTVKGFHIVEAGLSIASAILSTGKEIIFKDLSDINHDFIMAVQNKTDEVKDKIFVIGTKDLKDVDFYGDLTVFKSAWDFGRLPVAFNAMEIGRKYTGKTSLAIQTASSWMALPEFKDVLLNIAEENLDKLFKLRNKEEISLSDIQDIEFPDNSLMAVSPAFVMRDKVLFDGYLKQKMNAVEKFINELKFDVDGVYGKIVYDKGLDFGIKILADDEVFVGGEYYKDILLDINRFPHNCSGEHFLCKAVSRKTILRRIDQLMVFGEIPANIYNTIRYFYEDLKEGLIAVPSANPRFAALLGGCDYDGDGVIAYADTRIIELAKQTKSVAIDFGKTPKNKEVVKMNLWVKDKIYANIIANANDPIGVATNRNMMFVSLASEIDKLTDEEFNTLVNLVKAADKTKDGEYPHFCGNELYQRRYTADSVLIDAAETSEFINETMRCGFNIRANWKNILTDAQMVSASVIGRNIDSNKSGEKVPSLLKFIGKAIAAGMIKNIRFEVKEINNRSDWEINYVPITTGFNGKKYIINDAICQVKNHLGSMAKEYFQALKDQCSQDLNLEKDTKSSIKTRSIVEEIALINSAVSDADNYKDLKKYVVSFVRGVTKEHTPEERYNLVKTLSHINRGRSRFYLSFGPEALLSALGNDNYEVSQKLYAYGYNHVMKEGEEILLKKGRNKDVYCSANITGRFYLNEKGHVSIPVRKYFLDNLNAADTNMFALRLKGQGKANKIAKNIIACREKEALFYFSGDTLIATKDSKSFTVSQAYYRKGFPGWELLNNKKVAIDYVEVINGFVYIFGSFSK